jgi:PAS domain S-box-containing protein
MSRGGRRAGWTLAALLALAAAGLAAPARAGKGRIVVGVQPDMEPYEYVAAGQAKGFDVDLVRAVAKAADVEVSFVVAPWSELRRGLEEGEIDLLASVIYSDARAHSMALSAPHTLIRYAAFVRQGGPTVVALSDLAGKAVAVQRGDIMDDVLSAQGSGRIARTATYGEALRRVAAGAHDCALAPRVLGLLTVKRLALGNLTASQTPIFEGTCRFAARPARQDLILSLNEGLATVKATGEYDLLYQSWLGSLDTSALNRSYVSRHGVIFLGTVGALALLSLAWLWTLSRRVAHRTRALNDELVERRRIEAALRASELRFRALADTTRVGILIYQGDNFVYANRAAEQITGFSASELADKTFWESVYPGDAATAAKRQRAEHGALADAPIRYEMKFLTKGGAERWLEVAVAHVTIQGAPSRVVTIEDISERKRLVESRLALYQISEAAHTAADLDQLYRSIHLIIGRLMPAQNFYIALYDAERDLLSFPYFVDEHDAKPEPFTPGDGMTSFVLRSGRPLLASDAAVSELEQRGELTSLGSPSLDWLGVPLKVRERTVGVLTVQSYSGAVRYTESDRDMLTYVSTQVAQAIERKTAEQQLRESQRTLATLMGNLPGMAYRCRDDEQWTMEFASQGTFELTGYRPEELVANRVAAYGDLIVPEDRTPIADAVHAALTRHEAFEINYRIRSRDGREKWLWERGGGVFGDAGELLALEGFIADITRARAAEEALRQSEERYRLALQATQDIMYDSDLSTGNIVWSPNVSKVLGVGLDELGSGMEWWISRIHPDDRSRVRLETGAAIERGETFAIEYRVVTESGSWATVLDRGLVICAPSGTAVRVVGAVTDLTARRELEDQLRQAQKMEAVGHLAGGIAHDFNNLLTALIGSTELLQRHLRSDRRAQDELDVVHRTAERAASLTRRLLAFARREVVAPATLDLNGVIDEALPILRRMIPENITIAFIPDGRPATVRGDHSQLTQILLNLCVNSRDAMPGGGQITIATSHVAMGVDDLAAHPGAKVGRFVCLAFSDTGRGIDADDLPHIFEPFFTTKSRRGGTGLGLSTVYGIVKQHGGTVYANSAPAQGAAFKIYLPAAAGRAHAVPSVEETLPAGGNETILLVEDETEVRQVLVHALSGLGYRLFEAGDGEEALDVLERQEWRVDLVLTDVVMPKMGGRELYERVRQHNPEQCFLFSSGFMEEALPPELSERDGVFFLAKPYGIATLTRTVRGILDGQGAHADA